MVKVWVLIFFMSGMQGNNMSVIEDISTQAECERVATEMKQVRLTSDFSFRCFEIEKVISFQAPAVQSDGSP